MISKQFKKELIMDFYKMQLYHIPGVSLSPNQYLFNNNNFFTDIIRQKQIMKKYKNLIGINNYNNSIFENYFYYDYNIDPFNVKSKRMTELEDFFIPFEHFFQLYKYFLRKILYPGFVDYIHIVSPYKFIMTLNDMYPNEKG
jgi:hypothetical protein